ncbi:unnamed protein product, partial [Phaeothamnion confervicola]
RREAKFLHPPLQQSFSSMDDEHDETRAPAVTVGAKSSSNQQRKAGKPSPAKSTTQAPSTCGEPGNLIERERALVAELEALGLSVGSIEERLEPPHPVETDPTIAASASKRPCGLDAAVPEDEQLLAELQRMAAAQHDIRGTLRRFVDALDAPPQQQSMASTLARRLEATRRLQRELAAERAAAAAAQEAMSSAAAAAATTE